MSERGVSRHAGDGRCPVRQPRNGLTLDEILDSFPTPDRDDMVAVLGLMPDMIAAAKAA